MMTWSKDELRKIAEADDLHISPFREDGVTYGTPTWIWSVKHLSQNNFSDFTSYKALCSWQYGVIPVTMEFIFFDPHSGEFLI